MTDTTASLPAGLLRTPHIALMGGQSQPNIIALRELAATAVRVVCSTQTEPLVPAFLHACKALA